MKERDFNFECGQVAHHWGERMPMMVMEEAGELIQAISKFERSEKDITSSEFDNLIDEIGDMTIALRAIQFHYWNLTSHEHNTIRTRVNQRIETKLKKKYE